MGIEREYQKGDLTINWEPDKCIHSGICVKGLPDVFKPKDRPWVHVDKASAEAIKNQIDQCPSGALSYTETNSQKPQQALVEIDIAKNGPLLVKGNCNIKDANGQNVDHGQVTALCRCGASKNKPFCDGAHKEIHFDDSK